jgi:hypothetical protein
MNETLEEEKILRVDALNIYGITNNETKVSV